MLQTKPNLRIQFMYSISGQTTSTSLKVGKRSASFDRLAKLKKCENKNKFFWAVSRNWKSKNVNKIYCEWFRKTEGYSAASKIGFSVQSLKFLKQYQIKLIMINVYVSVMLGSTLKSYFRRGAAQMCCLYSPMIRKTNLKCRHQFKSSFSKTSDASL